MDIVTKESDRLSRIIEDCLDYARPEKLDAVETDLVALVRETTELLENSPELSDGHTLVVAAATELLSALVDAGGLLWPGRFQRGRKEKQAGQCQE